MRPYTSSREDRSAKRGVSVGFHDHGEEGEGELENHLDLGVAKDCVSHVLEFISLKGWSFA